MSMTSIFRFWLPIGTLVPAAVAGVTAAISTSGGHWPSTLLLYLTVADLFPFALLWLAARSLGRSVNPERRRGLVVIPTVVAFILMTILAVWASVALELSVRQGGPGASTNAIAVVIVPILLTMVGVISFAIAALITAVFRNRTFRTTTR